MEEAAPAPSQVKIEIMSLLSMIFGIVGIVTTFVYIGWALLTAAVVLGIIGLVKIKKNPGKFKGKGFAIAGIILGGFGYVVGILVFTVLAGLFMMM